MPVSVVVGGQYGSEGKGKVAHDLARARDAAAVVRVGGPNSGHTVWVKGHKVVLRQLSVAALIDGCLTVIAPGSYIDEDVLQSEVSRHRVRPGQLIIDPRAAVISAADKKEEQGGELGGRIGSTCSGTGATVGRRVARGAGPLLVGASSASWMRPYISDAVAKVDELLSAGERVVLEGTQGYGLSVLHSPYYPFATSRDTTAAGVLSEAGLSPLQVDEVIMVLRAHPIRVAGNSGPFGTDEIDWNVVTAESGSADPMVERTTVTDRIRRVARFDPEIVRRAIMSNQPTSIVLNHLDYVDASCRSIHPSERALTFLRSVEQEIGRGIDTVGTGPETLFHIGGRASLVA